MPLLQVPGAKAAAVAGSRGHDQGTGRRRLRSSLVVAEVAFSMILLIGAGLMVRTFVALRSLGLGFEPRGLLTVRTGARGAPEGFEEFYRRVGESFDTLPGVERVGACEILPMFAAFRPSLSARGAHQPPAADGSQPQAIPLRASVGFFEAFGLPIVRGRAFTPDDRPDTEPVAVVSRGLARQIWGTDDIVGRQLVLDEGDGRTVRVVGVSGDLRGLVQAPEPPPILYLPSAQDPARNMSFFLRVRSDPRDGVTRSEERLLSLVPEAEQKVWAINRDAPVFLATTMGQMVRDIEWQPRFVMQLLVGFASFALLLAATGLFAVLSYAVTERRREIGVRVALGARRGDVVRMVLGDAARLTVIGLVAGVAGALVLSRFLAGQLYGVRATDPLTYGALAALLAAVALASASLPALRATRVDPVEALRSE